MNTKKIILLGGASLLGFFFGLLSSASADSSFSPTVVVHDPNGNLGYTYRPYEKSFSGGISVAAGDTDGDGNVETIIATGPGKTSSFTIWENDHIEWQPTTVFKGEYSDGLNVSTGDVDGDGRAEVLVAKHEGADSKVEIWDVDDDTIRIKTRFSAFSSNVSHGVTLSTGDIDGDGDDEIVCGRENGSMEIKIYNLNHGTNLAEDTGDTFDAFDGYRKGGVFTAVVKRSLDEPTQIVLAEAHSNGRDDAMVRFYNKDGSWAEEEFAPYGYRFRGGITLSRADLDGDGLDEIMTGTTKAGPNVKILSQDGALLHEFMAYPTSYDGGLSVALSPSAAITTPLSGYFSHTGYKSILVDLSEQRLYMYEGVMEKDSFLISSGTWLHPSPTGTFHIIRKEPEKLYRSPPGAPDYDYYYLPGTKWNLRITDQGHYIHGAFWHNNFGQRMSHGCINVSYSNMEGLYDWADVDMEVKIQD